MEARTDPLGVLISSDAKAVDRKKLAELLAPFVAIDRETNEFAFTAGFEEVGGNDLKIELVLASAKARALLFDQPDGMSPSQIMDLGIMADGSVKTSLKRLFDGRKVRKDKEGRYVIPPHRITDLSKRLSNRSEA